MMIHTQPQAGARGQVEKAAEAEVEAEVEAEAE
jgi:hypothetical protein